MSSRAHAQGRPVLITNARRAKSLDANQRNKRYLLTMAVRVVCFLGGVAAPTPWNWVLFIGAAVIPPMAVMLANAVDLRRFAKLSLVSYVLMGWVVIVAIVPLSRSLAPGGLALLFGGGVFYTAGAAVYAFGKRSGKKFVHSAWHFFVLFGSILHYFCVLLFVIPT